MINKEKAVYDEVSRRSGLRRRLREAGQLIPIFALSIFVLVGMMAIVIDVSWYWSNTLRVQRAADAAALAGAVWLPGKVNTAYTTANQEATKNGYTTAVGGATVTPIQDSQTPGGTNPNQLDVTVSAPVNTFFMRVFGFTSITATRSSKAEFVQPVPMGSPLNYYGISCLIPKNASVAWPTPACAAAGNSNGPSGVMGAGTAPQPQLGSQGFWGVVFQRGGDSRNGDAFSPLQISNGAAWVSNSNPPNPQGNFQPSGYTYAVEVPTAGGAVYLFDPEFCEVGENGDGQFGVGDQYTGQGPTVPAGSPNAATIVTTYYNLYNTQGTAFTTTDDTLVTQSVYSDAFQTDQTKNLANQYVWGTPARAGARDCGLDPAHNQWVLLANGLPAAKYRLQVTTTNVDTSPPSGGTVAALGSQPSDLAGAANRFGIEVTSGGSPRVYGDGLMGAYNNLPAGTQLFYLAQIDKRNAGKTAIINLYDPGDVGGGAWLRILTPDGNQYHPAAMSWTSVSKADGSAGPAGSGTCIQTNSANHANTPPAGCPNASGGSNNFDARWLTINVAIPQGYGTAVPATGGSVGLTPPGEPGAGWWKIEYTVNGGNDTTTWQVSIRGNPVHLVVP